MTHITGKAGIEGQAMRIKQSNKYLILICLILFLLIPATAHAAWPSVNSDWIPLYNTAGPIGDPTGDGAGPRDIVGSTTYPAGYLYNDGAYIYYRIRLDEDPWQSAAQKLKPFGWGFIIDTDQDTDYYEWMVMIDGITDVLYIAENTIKTTCGGGALSCPSEKAEVVVYSEALTNAPAPNTSGNFQVSLADSTFNSNADYFIDFRFPYATWLNEMGLTESSPIRYFIGSSNQAQTLTADLVGGTYIYEGISNTVLPNGKMPTDGTVRFVTSNYTTDLEQIYPGQTIYIRVEDVDRNSMYSTAETITVIVNAPSGDSVTVTLTETGVNTSVFVGSVVTSGGTINTGDSILQVVPVEAVKVTYVDLVAANLDKNVNRTDSLNALQSADLSMAKVVNTSTPTLGQIVNFTLTLTNNGPSNASGITVRDLLPAGLIYNSDNGAGSYNNVTGDWSVALLNSGSNKSLVINALVNATGTHTNIANITSAVQYDSVTANNVASASVTAGGANLAITKTASNYTPNVNDYINFILTVSNLGTNNATNVVVYDLLAPAKFIYNTSSGDGAFSNTTGLWSVGNIPSGASRQHTINVRIAAGTGGTLQTNTAIINSADQGDPVTSNNTANVTLAIGGADLSITKVANTTSADVGQNIIYTLTVTNNGSAAVTNATVLDVLPSGLTYVSSAGTGSFSNATGVWTLPTPIANGASTARTITASVNSGKGGSTITNIANIASADQTDPSSVNNTYSAPVYIKTADLAVTKIVNTPNPNVGDTVKYTVTVKNNGPDNATGVVLRDQLPTGVTHVNNNSGGSYNTGTGYWTVGSISNGATATLIINATVNAGTANTTITNIANITSAGQEDKVSSNNSASASFLVNGIDLRVVKGVSNAMPSAGDPISYTVVVTNISNTPATGIEIIDLLPGGVSYVSDTRTQGTYNKTSGLWRTLSITNGASATLTINVTVDAGTTGQTIRNTARLNASTQSDYDSSNNQSSVDIYVGATDVGIAKIVNNPTPNVGDNVTYTLTVSNYGPNVANSISVYDMLPSGLNYVSSSGHGLYNASTGIWNSLGILNGTTGVRELYTGLSNSIDIIASIGIGTNGTTILNNAYINTVGPFDGNSANNSATATLVVQSADLAITKIVNDSTPSEGGTVKFDVMLTNYGPHTATNISVTDFLPVGLTYINDNGSAIYNSTTRELTWSVASLAKLTTSTLIINATADMGTGGSTLTNIANITSADQADPVPGNNSASIDVSPTALPYPNLLMSKSVLVFSDPINVTNGDQKAIPGAVMIYTITVQNIGDGAAESSRITDPIPAQGTYINNSITLNGSPLSDAADADAADYDLTTAGAVTVNLGDIPAFSGVYTITFKVGVN